MTALLVDARGMRCPWPALRLSKAMNIAEEVHLLADDPAAPAEIDALARLKGWEVIETSGRFVVRQALGLRER